MAAAVLYNSTITVAGVTFGLNSQKCWSTTVQTKQVCSEKTKTVTQTLKLLVLKNCHQQKKV